MRSAAEAQITALKTTCDAGAGAVSDMQRRQADAAAGLQNELQRVSKSVDETYQRVTGLNQRYRENDAQAEALARRQDALAESFFRQIDGVRSSVVKHGRWPVYRNNSARPARRGTSLRVIISP